MYLPVPQLLVTAGGFYAHFHLQTTYYISPVTVKLATHKHTISISSQAT